MNYFELVDRLSVLTAKHKLALEKLTKIENNNAKCKCTVSISVLGDGCRYCQPQTYIDMLVDQQEDTAQELECITIERNALRAMLQTQ